MITGSLLTADELQAWLGYDRDGDLKRALEAKGIAWIPGKGGRPCTTIDLINQGMGLERNAANRPLLDPNDV